MNAKAIPTSRRLALDAGSLAAGLLAALFAMGSQASGVEVVAHRYLPDPSGALDTATVAANPAQFQPLPAWWQRDVPGGVRWERLDLRWHNVEVTPATEPVIHVRTLVGNHLSVFYGPSDPACGHTPPSTIDDKTTPLNIARWATVPLCPGAQAVYARFNTTRDTAPLIRVQTRAEAAKLDYSSTANAYGVALLILFSVILGLAGTWRSRDAFWAGLLTRTLLVTPYFAQHGAAPDHAPAEPLIRWVSVVPPDVLLALLTLGHSIFLLGFLWPHTKPGWLRHALRGLCVGAIASVLLAVAAPYPFGMLLSLALTLLSAPVALGVVWRGFAEPEEELPRSLRRWQLLSTLSVVLLGFISTALVYHAGYWRPLQFTVALFYLSVAVWVALRATIRRTLAASALFKAQLSRQRADDHAREQEERRLETRDLMLMLTHEIRTPLAVLRLSVDAVGKSEQARRRVHEAILEMDRLIERCLETARLDTETPDDAVGGWVARQALRETAARSRSPERVQIHVADGADLPRSRPVVINAIVSILVDNALRYGAPTTAVMVDGLPAFTPPEGHGPATTTARPVPLRTAPGVAIVISNTIGPAGPPDPARVFQKYYRGPGAHRQSGAGLGLYLASRLVDRLGGTLAHDSTAQLTRFTLWIPR